MSDDTSDDDLTGWVDAATRRLISDEPFQIFDVYDDNGTTIRHVFPAEGETGQDVTLV